MSAAHRNGTVHVEPVMGTMVTLDVRDQDLAPGAAQTAVMTAVQGLHKADRTFSTYDPESPISRLRRGETTLDQCPPVVGTVLDLCAEAREHTDGWFDPWAMPRGLDPTGLVKGWAVDQALATLRFHGVRHAMVNAGGDLVVAGTSTGSANGNYWNIGIVDPHRPESVLDVVSASDLAAATSASYERGSLAVDPHSQLTVHRLASATVIAPNLALADAYATAATAQGPEALTWLSRRPGVCALLVTPDGTQVRHRWPTPGPPARSLRGSTVG